MEEAIRLSREDNQQQVLDLSKVTTCLPSPRRTAIAARRRHPERARSLPLRRGTAHAPNGRRCRCHDG